jgi:hypothetical protein
MLEQNDASQPALYFSRVAITDNRMRRMRSSRIPGRIDFLSALVENCATGCTIVMNRSARALLIQKTPKANLFLHDWWCYLVVSAIGTVYFDREETVFHRFHRNNSSYAMREGMAKTKARASRLLLNDFHYISKQAEALIECFGNKMDCAKREHVLRLLSLKKPGLLHRLPVVLFNPYRRQQFGDEIFLRLFFLLGIF